MINCTREIAAIEKSSQNQTNAPSQSETLFQKSLEGYFGNPQGVRRSRRMIFKM